MIFNLATFWHFGYLEIYVIDNCCMMGIFLANIITFTTVKNQLLWISIMIGRNIGSHHILAVKNKIYGTFGLISYQINEK